MPLTTGHFLKMHFHAVGPTQNWKHSQKHSHNCLSYIIIAFLEALEPIIGKHFVVRMSPWSKTSDFFKLFIYFLEANYFTILYWFCHTLTWISHGCPCVPHPEPPSHLSPHPIPLGHPSAPALSTLYHASNLDWQSVSHMIIYMFQCHFPKPSHPHPLPQSPKVCSIHLCLFCCLAYRVIVTIFLNSIDMC